MQRPKRCPGISWGKEDYDRGRYLIIETKKRFWVFYTIRPHSLLRSLDGGICLEVKPK